jgi:hypothetical protein
METRAHSIKEVVADLNAIAVGDDNCLPQIKRVFDCLGKKVPGVVLDAFHSIEQANNAIEQGTPCNLLIIQAGEDFTKGSNFISNLKVTGKIQCPRKGEQRVSMPYSVVAISENSRHAIASSQIRLTTFDPSDKDFADDYIPLHKVHRNWDHQDRVDLKLIVSRLPYSTPFSHIPFDQLIKSPRDEAVPVRFQPKFYFRRALYMPGNKAFRKTVVSGVLRRLNTAPTLTF